MMMRRFSFVRTYVAGKIERAEIHERAGTRAALDRNRLNRRKTPQ